MPKDRTLTPADVDAIVAALHDGHYVCPFSVDEVAAIHDLLKLLQETRSHVIKAIVTVIIGAFFVALALGIKVWAKQ